MMKLKKMVFAVAMMVTVGTVATPVTGAEAATKINYSSQTNSNSFTKGKLCYQITGKNTCTVTGLSASGKKSSTCKIPSTVNCNGKTYKVANVSNNAFKNSNNLNSITCNKSVKANGSNCFGNVSVQFCK